MAVLLGFGALFVVGWCGAYAVMAVFTRAEPVVAIVALLLLTGGLVSLETGREAPTSDAEWHQAEMASHLAYVSWLPDEGGCHPFAQVRERMALHVYQSNSSFLPYWGERDCPAIETEAAQRTVAILDAAFMQARAAGTQESPLRSGDVWRALLPAGLGLLGGLATARVVRRD